MRASGRRTRRPRGARTSDSGLSSGPLFATPIPVHDIVGVPTGSHCGGHHPHGSVNMAEEELIARAQVVEAGFAVRSGGEAILRTTAVAGEPHVAGPAVRRQGIALGVTEGLL